MSLDPNSYMAKFLLATAITRELEDEFSEIYLTHNLVDTIEVRTIGEDIEIEIPAVMYDVAFWKKKGVLVYNQLKASYASEVDETGGFSHRHTNFIERAIDKAISQWISELSVDCEVKEGEENK